MFEREIVIDGKGHLLGRLASIVAHEILRGQKVVVVRAEGLDISGHKYRNRIKFMDFIRKHRNSNPKKGSHIHYHSPARIFWRTVRGMVPHKTTRGAEALGKLKVFEGIPAPYDERKRQVVPDALTVLRVKTYRKVTNLGELASSVGWTKADVVASLEEKRQAR